MTYTPGHIANFMLDRADAECRPVSPMKLLKLVYIAHGWSLALLDRKAFEETIYAWQHGPVVKSLYHEFKHFGKRPIEAKSVTFDLETFDFSVPSVSPEDKEMLIVLDRVWEVYKGFDAWSLRNKTHEAGTPWSQVYREGEQDVAIPDNLIKPHFEQKIRQYLENASSAG